MTHRLIRLLSWLLALASCTLVGAAVSPSAPQPAQPLATVMQATVSNPLSRVPHPAAERKYPSRLFGGPAHRRTRIDPQQTGWRLDELEGELTVLRRLADQHHQQLDQLARARPSDPWRVREDLLAQAAALLWLTGAALLARALLWRLWRGPLAAAARTRVYGLASLCAGAARPSLLRKHWRAQ